MGSFRLLKFEVKKQLNSITLLIVFAIITVFAISQLTGVFHIPVSSDKDIEVLRQNGELEYIFVDNSDEELIAMSLDFLNNRIADGSIPQNVAVEFDDAIEMLESGTHSFDDVMQITKDNKFVSPWVMVCYSQFSQRLGTVEEVNGTMLSAFVDNGYTSELYQKYVTYMQMISAFIIFPLFLFLFTRDYRSGMYEILYMQPIKEYKYILLRYLGVFIPLTLYLYGFGLILNLISAIRFITLGYPYQYTRFFSTFMLYLFPALFFFSTLITMLMLMIKKAVAVFPIYIIFVILSATPGVFNFDGNIANIISPIIRLDEQTGGLETNIINRIIYIVLGGLFLALSCKFYKNMKTDLRKGITI